MKKEYSELLNVLRQGNPAMLCTRKTVDGQTIKWVLSNPGDPAEKEADFMEYYKPEERLIILGGFAVTVVDDRPSFANRERFPKARQILCESFERCFDKLHITSSDYVAVVTRGHRYDMECLRKLLSGREPAYVGMMGSKRRVAGVRELLLSEGYRKEAIERIHMPIGLSIGALSPAEIAVSILAEMIQERRHIVSAFKMSAADADFRVLERLSEENEPYAVATVLSARGSTPRRSGAKMIIYREGRIYGSIGGGCAEAQVIREALKYIGTGRYTIMTVDMTKDVSEEDAMVCGGVMDVLIEGTSD